MNLRCRISATEYCNVAKIAESAIDILSKNGYSEDTDKMFKDAGVCLEMI